MVAKKKAAKKVAKKKVVKKVSKKKVSRKSSPKTSKKVSSIPKKVRIATNNLVLFTLIALVSGILYQVANNTFYTNLLYLTAMISGFIALAFLLVIIVFFFLKKEMKK